MFIQICVDISLFKSYYMDVLRKRHNKNKSCTGAKLLREHKMKKTIMILLVLVLAAAGLFAAVDSTPKSFEVSTNIQGINKMIVSTSQFSGNSPGTFDDLAAYAGLTIGGSGTAVTTDGVYVLPAYLSTISNNRKGYTVTMGATAMKSEVAVAGVHTYINYAVSCNTKSVSTNGASTVTAVPVFEVGTQAGISSKSEQITISVNKSEFDAAVDGAYTGTVTFTYTANN